MTRQFENRHTGRLKIGKPKVDLLGIAI